MDNARASGFGHWADGGGFYEEENRGRGAV